MFLGLLDPEPFARRTTDLDPDPDPSIIKRKKNCKKNLKILLFVPRKVKSRKARPIWIKSMLICKTSGLLLVRIAQGDFPLAQNDSQRMFASTLMYGFLQAFFVSKETPTAERRQEKETL